MLTRIAQGGDIAENGAGLVAGRINQKLLDPPAKPGLIDLSRRTMAELEVEAGLGQVNDDMTASARSLGSRPLGVATRIHLPLTRTSVFTAMVLVAVDALKELPIVLLLRPFGFDTLSVWTFNLASESRFEQAALPALAIVVVALIPVAVLSRSLESRSKAERAIAPMIDPIQPEAQR